MTEIVKAREQKASEQKSEGPKETKATAPTEVPKDAKPATPQEKQ